MRRPRRPAQDLRFTIECLPRRTRVAMLQGIDSNTIIVGAYTDRDGGVCPMLAAHRCGGRTDLASFARAWDRYTHVGRRARDASGREIGTLRAMLEGSLAQDESVRGELGEAIAELKAVRARREADEHARIAAAEAEVEVARVAAQQEDRERTDAHERARLAAAEHSAPDTGERDRFDELETRPGWSWLRVFRRYDEYEAALERVRRAEEEVERRERELV